MTFKPLNLIIPYVFRVGDKSYPRSLEVNKFRGFDVFLAIDHFFKKTEHFINLFFLFSISQKLITVVCMIVMTANSFK